MIQNELGYRVAISQIRGIEEFQETVTVQSLTDLKSKLTDRGAKQVALRSIWLGTDLKDTEFTGAIEALTQEHFDWLVGVPSTNEFRHVEIYN